MTFFDLFPFINFLLLVGFGVGIIRWEILTRRLTSALTNLTATLRAMAHKEDGGT